MQVSVVVPTLNGRERLASCLDALADHAPSAEVIVANGPSTDGTTGMVRDREDVDVLIELSERNVNVARNAGVGTATGDVVALLDDDVQVEPGWLAAVGDSVAVGADVVTGPTHQELVAGMTTDERETRRIAGREVTYFDGGNVAFTRESLAAIDGFDEYLHVGGARDAAHRLAGRGRSVEWQPDMTVRRELGADGGADVRAAVSRPQGAAADGGAARARACRSLAYRLVKNYGPRPCTVRRIVARAVEDARTSATAVLRGDVPPSRLVGHGRGVVYSLGVGAKDGLAARLRDRSRRRNPNGVASRADRSVERYDWR